MQLRTDMLTCLRELVVSGAEVNIQNKKGWTALMIAARYGHYDCLHELVAAGAECLHELVTAGAEANIQDNKGWAALMVAAQNGHVDCLRELIVSGAEVNIQE